MIERDSTSASADGARNLAHVARDRGYRFVDRDPALDEVARMITDSGLSISEIIERIEAISDTATVSYSTIVNWLSGKTKRPQNYTVTWVAAALGFERKWTRRGRR